ncbi:MAG: trimethylamine methyltransferase family protein [Kiritimatiellaeota bacterium]|nr:trimethylamine methyltransferase family protein [Kiritimatiellota bacterium]
MSIQQAEMKVNMLGKEAVSSIHKYSVRILKEIGVEIGDPRILKRLVSKGAKDVGRGRVCFDAAMIKDALAHCPPEFDVFSVCGEKHRIGGAARQYSTCCVDPGMNSASNDNRPPRLDDCANNAKIIDSLKLITMPYKMDVNYNDVPTALSVLKSNEAYFSNSTKHVLCGPCNESDARIWMEMGEIMAPDTLRKTPTISVLVSPSSPLALHLDCLEILQCALEYGAPVICLPCPMCGETSPLSVAGTVMDLNAENLALIIVTQILRPGHPVIYHTVGMPADMRVGCARMTGPEKMLMGIAAAQMGRFYGLPSGTAGASTDVNAFDVQNGAETMSQILSAVLGPANLITGLGSNSNGCGTSAEQILIDYELLLLAEHLHKGIRMDNLKEAFDSIMRVGPGGNFMTDEHTVKQCRSAEFFEPDLLDWTGRPDAGKGCYRRAGERAQSILQKHHPLVPQDRLAKLRAYVVSKSAKLGAAAKK